MILTCPECDTSYFVDDLRIPRLGRMVRCSSCGHRWRAFQDRSDPESAAPDDDLLVEGPGGPAPPPDEQVDFVVAPPKAGGKAARPKTPLAAAIAAGVAVGVALLLAGVILARQQVAGVIPGAAPLFSAIGLPVNTIGLVLEGVTSKETFQAGRPVLAVTGAVRSVVDEPTQAPPIRISLLDKHGKPLTSLVAEPLNGRVPPGAKRYFAVSLPDPPAGARELEVAFDPGAKTTAAAPAPAPPPAAGPAPVEAQPLPADSPDALKPHEQH
jgi:predicted Zn finger-like uncharacterized protein